MIFITTSCTMFLCYENLIRYYMYLCLIAKYMYTELKIAIIIQVCMYIHGII